MASQVFEKSLRPVEDELKLRHAKDANARLASFDRAHAQMRGRERQRVVMRRRSSLKADTAQRAWLKQVHADAIAARRRLQTAQTRADSAPADVHAMGEALRSERGLLHEYAPHAQPDGPARHYLLSSAEGPSRMRKRLEANPAFDLTHQRTGPRSRFSIVSLQAPADAVAEWKVRMCRLLSARARLQRALYVQP